MKIKGMRDIQTIYGRVHRVLSRTRAQVVAELAYLEHEKDRLERELAIWVTNQKQTEGRYESVRKRISVLQGILEEQSADNSPTPPPSKKAVSRGRQACATWHEVPLEY